MWFKYLNKFAAQSIAPHRVDEMREGAMYNDAFEISDQTEKCIYFSSCRVVIALFMSLWSIVSTSSR